NSASGGSPAGQHDGYVYNSAGTLSFTFEFNSLNFVRPYLGEDVVYGRYGALAPYNDFYGVQRRIPLTYNYTAAGAAFGPPAEEITAPAVFFPEANFNNTSDGVNRFATVAKVQALGAELDGKILLCPRATGADAAQRTANAAVVKAAQALGAVAVVFCGQTSSNSGYENTDYYIGTSNTASIASQSNTNPAANLVGFTGDALDIRIPVSGTTKAMLREYHEWVQKGGENKLTLTALGNSETGGNSILEHYERNVGAFLYNIEAASIYTSYIKGNIYDSAAAGASLVSGASLDLRLDAPSQIQSSNGTQLPANTYVDVRRSHLDTPDGSYSWAVTPSQQRGFSSHFANEGYAVTASANGRYSDTKNVVVADYKALVGNVNFVVPNAIATDFDFGKAWGPVGTVTVPFSTWLPNGAKGVIDGAAVTATVGGLPIAVNSLGGGNYTATFDPVDLALGTDSAQLVIDFDGGAAHSAFAADIDFACVYVDLSTDNVSYISEDVNYTVSLRDAVDVLAVELEFTIDGSMLAGKGLEGLNGFGNMNNVLWIYAGDNLWTGTVTLDLPSGTTTGLTDAGPVDVAVFSYTAKNYGNAAMTLTGARAVGLFGDTTKYLTTAVGDGAAISIIAKSKYDLNRDGVVDALDLGIMLLYCGFDCDGADWDALVKVNDAWGNPVTASMCDVNGDGLIDMLDLLDLFIHYTK
ncbi:MAG: dockerin type I domain-containing protein, partial [Clostridiales bacterium]|nr:dockerin type I domain-containing protein [Clostridiales bacterium]